MLSRREIDWCTEVYTTYQRVAGEHGAKKELLQCVAQGVDVDLAQVDPQWLGDGQLWTLEDTLDFATIVKKQGKDTDPRLQETLDAFVHLGGNADGSSTIKSDVLRDTISQFPISVDINRMIEEVDADHSGEIDFDEFSKLYDELQEDGLQGDSSVFSRQQQTALQKQETGKLRVSMQAAPSGDADDRAIAVAIDDVTLSPTRRRRSVAIGAANGMQARPVRYLKGTDKLLTVLDASEKKHRVRQFDIFSSARGFYEKWGVTGERNQGGECNSAEEERSRNSSSQFECTEVEKDGNSSVSAESSTTISTHQESGKVLEQRHLKERKQRKERHSKLLKSSEVLDEEEKILQETLCQHQARLQTLMEAMIAEDDIIRGIECQLVDVNTSRKHLRKQIEKSDDSDHQQSESAILLIETRKISSPSSSKRDKKVSIPHTEECRTSGAKSPPNATDTQAKQPHPPSDRGTRKISSTPQRTGTADSRASKRIGAAHSTPRTTETSKKEKEPLTAKQHAVEFFKDASIFSEPFVMAKNKHSLRGGISPSKNLTPRKLAESLRGKSLFGPDTENADEDKQMISWTQ